MIPLPGVRLFVSDLDLILLALSVVNAILLFGGIGRFAVFNAVDAVLHLFFPKTSVKYDYRRYYPKLVKSVDGETMKTFRTPRDEYYPEYGPLHQRIGDFFLRFPLFSLTFFILLAPVCMKVYRPYFDALFALARHVYPAFPVIEWTPISSKLFRICLILFFLPFSSLHSTQISLYAIVVYPFIALAKILEKGFGTSYWLAKNFVPPILYTALFVFLFLAEVLLIYTGFLPLFHQGLIPFIENGPGLKQMVFWMPVKLKVYVDLILTPIVVVVPFVTTIGSYILARNDMKEGENETNYLVLFYKTGISYLYAPVLGGLFPKLRDEARAIRKERRINEILVLGMYLESIVCVAGMGYAYWHLSKASQVPFSGILIGLLVLIVFVPLIVFSSNGFQSYFLDKSIALWTRLKEKFVFGRGKVAANA